MNKKFAVSAVFLIICACIGWSSDQKEVLESYNSLIEKSNEENWHGLFRSLSAETKQLLDEIASVYTEAGAPFENSGEKLLASLISDTNLLSFSETVISIEFRNEKALLVAGQGNLVASYQFVQENSTWKLDLIPVMTEFLDDLLEGTATPVDSPVEVAPAHITAGDGEYELVIQNRLAGLSVLNVYCSRSDSESWGEDWLGSNILGSGAEISILLEAGSYDIQLIDSEGNTYTVWEVDLNSQGILWQLTEQDRDEAV